MQAKNGLKAKSASHSFRHIWLLESSNGRCEVEDFLLGLTNEDRHPERFQVLENPVFEFKIFKYRIICFKTGNNYVCVKGVKKRKDGHLRTTDDAIKATKRLAQQFAEEGVYREFQ